MMTAIVWLAWAYFGYLDDSLAKAAEQGSSTVIVRGACKFVAALAAAILATIKING